MYGEGAGALYEGDDTDGMGSGSSAVLVKVVDARISYSVDGGTANDCCDDPYEFCDEVVSVCIFDRYVVSPVTAGKVVVV